MTARHKILVIDDDDGMRELVCSVAQAMGFQCTATRDSATFLEKLEPDTTLILLDLMMPGTDGIELMRLLGERKCKAGIVLVSAVGKRTIESAGQLAQVLGLSIAGYLNKPFQVADLEEALRRLPSSASPLFSSTSPSAILKPDLQIALERGEFTAYYQPQINIATGRATGVEALARWNHPEQGLVFPDSFIDRMEKFGLIDDLGWVIANRGMSDIGQFAAGDPSAFTLSLNVSVNSLGDLAFPDTLVSIAQQHGVSPENVTVEITESCLITDLSRTLDILIRLRMKKVKLSIDDFGTGYAMLQQFKTIPATELKIDRSFVQGMVGDDINRIWVRKIIEMGHELGMQVVAEGVETQEQLDLLSASGCDRAQGYVFCRPIPATEMLSWLKSHRLEQDEPQQTRHAQVVAEARENAVIYPKNCRRIH